MAGIMGNSVSVAMGSGDTAVDNTQTGYLRAEQITLTASPAGTDYIWSIALPSASASARSGLTASTGTSTAFTPDISGDFVVTCDVDGTTYRLTCSVVNVSVAEELQVLRLAPVTDASVPTPPTGHLHIYCSSTQSNALAQKADDGTVSTIDVTAV